MKEKFPNRHTGINEYTDFGGEIDKDEPHVLAKTATRELFEESRGLINIDYQHLLPLPFIMHEDVATKTNYACYAINVDSAIVRRNDFLTNMRIIDASVSPRLLHFKETIDIARFNVSDIIHDVFRIGGSIRCQDAYGNTQTIKGRTKACIRETIIHYLSNMGGQEYVTRLLDRTAPILNMGELKIVENVIKNMARFGSPTGHTPWKNTVYSHNQHDMAAIAELVKLPGNNVVLVPHP